MTPIDPIQQSVSNDTASQLAAELNTLIEQRNEYYSTRYYSITAELDLIEMNLTKVLQPNPHGLYLGGKLEPLAVVSDVLLDANANRPEHVIWPGLTRPEDAANEAAHMAVNVNRSLAKDRVPVLYKAASLHSAPVPIYHHIYLRSRARITAAGDHLISAVNLAAYLAQEWFEDHCAHTETVVSINPLHSCFKEEFKTWASVREVYELQVQGVNIRSISEPLTAEQGFMANKVYEKYEKHVYDARCMMEPLFKKLQADYGQFTRWNSFTVGASSSSTIMVKHAPDVRALLYLDMQIERVRNHISQVCG